MAQYEHLPIYKKAYDLALHFDKIVRNFSRYHNYQIGAEMREQSRDALRLIRRANDATEKAPILLQIRERLEELKMTVRLGRDLQAFQKFESFEYCINEVVDLCKQNEGWLKSMRPKSGRPESSSQSIGNQERANG
jgi:hypothetical protein